LRIPRDQVFGPSTTGGWFNPEFHAAGAGVARACPVVRPSNGSGRATWQAEAIETARIDQWLWSVRLTKTRADAATACRSGHVTVNGRTAKPSTPVKVGDRIVARLQQRERILDVVTVIVKRVGAAVSVACYVDHSLPIPERESTPPIFERDRGAGRPTKRDRRQLDKLRGRRR
jgi:ribosome-associated heat shock protein Hsp15